MNKEKLIDEISGMVGMVKKEANNILHTAMKAIKDVPSKRKKLPC